MSGRYLFDTNIVIALFDNEPAVIERLPRAEEVFIASVVIGELYYGAQNSNRVEENVGRVDEFVAENVILGCDQATAKWYGQAKSKLRQKGKPIPENDMWIAAIALQYDLVLVSRDRHFEEVEGLTIESWGPMG